MERLERNCAIKNYISNHFCQEPPEIEAARLLAKREGLKEIQVPQNVGRTLYLLAKLARVKRILEIGTLGGYSTLWLASALEEEGRLITLECDLSHIQVAQANFAHASFKNRIEIRKGLAADRLKEMVKEGEESFDLIFLDADKDRYPDYLEPCLALSRSGTLILSDNTIPKRGEVAIPDPRDNEAIGIYTYNQLIASHPRLESVILPTIVGEKGRVDGLGLSLVR